MMLRYAAKTGGNVATATGTPMRLSMSIVQGRSFQTTPIMAYTSTTAPTTTATNFISTPSATSLVQSRHHQHAQHQSLSLESHRPTSRSFSSTTDSSEKPSGGIWNRMTTAFTDRQKRQQQEQFAAQMKKMAESEQWTIQDFINDITLSVDSWRAKVPGMSSTTEVQRAKQMNNIAKAIAQEMGPNVTATELFSSGSSTGSTKRPSLSSSSSSSSSSAANIKTTTAAATNTTTPGLSRTQKLKISIASGASVQEVNLMLQQFMSVQLMHSVVRKRFLEDKPIPTDDVTMKRMLQLEGMQAMTKSERKIVKEMQMKRNMRGTGAGRRKK